MKTKHWTLVLILVPLFTAVGLWLYQSQMDYNTDHLATTEGSYFVKDEKHEVGDIIDSLNGVYVYYNGAMSHVEGRNVAPDGYNIGLKYQCVEFIKRYYYEYFNHKMPNSYGDAKDFFNAALEDGQMNEDRSLFQYNNPSQQAPKENDILIYRPTSTNQHGHVAIVSKIMENRIEIIQQNPGWVKPSRERYSLRNQDGKWLIDNGQVIAWLSRD